MSTLAAKSKATAKPRVSAKEAARAAAEYLRELVPVRGSPIVEEVELEGNKWMITLGFLPGEINDQQFGFTFIREDKEYKQFGVDARTGVVTSMKIRTVGQ